ncbi:hypothetical protein TRFO_20851 [Tritrichomonas foetus]|uniref:Uncharacterized protein n=1 Tax=Tritrichomonas foetus TaxID=1144522 RepID=A0A1J4KJP0_9EUKA|nr:hypothetical protein TRFO_20851 [Tritrichomonas foetus]|eukprot:OHT10044.1 hypothetical protein TRFO_20851 [Tritrichomonas foetus]
MAESPPLEELIITSNFPTMFNKVPPDDEKLNVLIDYALFGKEPEEKYKNLNLRKQIHNNSCHAIINAISIHYKIIEKTLNEKLLLFFQKDAGKYNILTRNCYFAGHFQLIFSKLIEYKLVNENYPYLDELFDFLINNSDISAYKHILIDLLQESRDDFQEKNKILLIKMMTTSAKFVAYFHNNLLQSDETPELIHEASKDIIPLETQPYNIQNKHIKLSQNLFKNNNLYYKKEKYEKLFKNHCEELFGKDFKFDECKQISQIQIYFLLSAISTALYENTIHLLSIIRDNEEIIKLFFFCGVYSNLIDAISYKCFQVLYFVYYGDDIAVSDTEDESVKPLPYDHKLYNILNKYADAFYFNPEEMTYQMVHAFPLFWNNRYNVDSYTLTDDEEQEIDIRNYYPENSHPKTTYKRSPGETPFEMFLPYLISEPPLCTRLIFDSMQIITRLLKERNQIIDGKDVKSRSRIVQIDSIIFELFRHPFVYPIGSNNPGKAKKSFIDTIPDVLVKRTKIKEEDSSAPIRIQLNGFLYELLRWYNYDDTINEWKLINKSSFFTMKSNSGKITPISKSFSSHPIFKKIPLYVSMIFHDSKDPESQPSLNFSLTLTKTSLRPGKVDEFDDKI